MLLVESEEGLGRVIEDTLEEAGFRVATACGGPEAVTKLDGSADFIAIVTDVDDLRAHQISGWEVARHARQLYPNIAVIYTSGGAGAEWAAEGVSTSTFLQKPFALAALITALSADTNRIRQHSWG